MRIKYRDWFLYNPQVGRKELLKCDLSLTIANMYGKNRHFTDKNTTVLSKELQELLKKEIG